MLISHFYNEEMMLPYWIQHHAPMFDHAVLINYNSTDKSVDIIRQTAPAGWKVISPADPNSFAALAVDTAVMKVENEHPNYWHIALTSTEFLVHPDFRASMARIDPKQGEKAIICFRLIVMAGNDDSPLKPFGSLPMQRSVFTDNCCGAPRFMHTGLQPRTWTYGPGRHHLHLHGVNVAQPYVDTGVIMKYSWTPWPEQKKRKMQIGARMPKGDIAKGWGTHHITNMNEAKLESERKKALQIRLRDLKTINLPPSDPARLLVQPFHQAFDPIQPMF